MPNDAWKTILTAIILFGIQLGAGGILEINGIRPDFLLLFVIVLSWHRGPLWGLSAGFLTGLCQDAFSIEFLGIFALAKSSIGFWLGRWFLNRQGIIFSWMWMVIFFLSTFVQYAWYGMFSILQSQVGYFNFLFAIALPTALYTSFLGWLWTINPFFSHWDKSSKKVKARKIKG